MTKKRKVKQRSRIKVADDLTKNIEAIFDDGVLIDLSIGQWSANRSNTEEDLGLKRGWQRPEYVAGLGTKRLVPKSLTDRWKAIAAKARYVVRRDAFQFPVGESMFVPKDMLPKIDTELRSLKRDYDMEIRFLRKSYDKIRLQTVRKYPQLAPLYPPRDEVLSKFYFTWQVYTTQLPRKAQLVAFDRKKEKAAEQAMQRYEQELETRVQRFLNEAVKTLRAKTVEICDAIVDKIKKKEVVTNRSLTHLREFIDRFKAMNFVGDAEVEKRLEMLQKDILRDYSADDFKDDETLRDTLAQALNQVKKVAEQVSDVSAVTGGYKRRIVV